MVNPALDQNGIFRLEGVNQGRNLLVFDSEFFRVYRKFKFSEKVSLELQEVHPLDGNLSGSHISSENLAALNLELKDQNLEVQQLFSTQDGEDINPMEPQLPKNSIFRHNLLIYLTTSPV